MSDPIRSKDDFLVFGSPAVGQEEIDEVADTIRSCWLGTGPRTARFEKEFAAYRKAATGVALNSCTAALHLSILGLNLKPGDEVITTPLTFCASVNAIIHSGAVPVLADIDPVTMNIDPDRVEEKITSKTRALLPVHYAGRACDMDRLTALADKHGLEMVEDCAHAIETEYKGKPAGSFGRFGCFSFYVTKNLITAEGGMILTNDAEAADRIKILALHGMSRDAWKRFGDEGYKHYFVTEAGFKYNMTDIQAAIGLKQLEKVERFHVRRTEIWDMYMERLSGLPVQLPAPPEPETRHARHLFTILVDEKRTGISRDAFLNGMTAQGIGTGVHYLSIPEHPYYKERFGWNPEEYPHAMEVGRQTVSLPLSAKMTDKDADDVIAAVERVLGRE